MAVGPEQRLSPEERANLAAYIDGELTEDEARAISTKLSFSPTARGEIESLKKTWELLDYLPRPKASDDFPERTLTTLRSLGARRLSWQEATSSWLGSASKVAACLAVAAGSIAAGFAITRWAVPDPEARMARELPLAEHLEEYQEVGTFEFLEELAQSKEFGLPPR